MKKLHLDPREMKLAALTLAVAFVIINGLLVAPWWRENRERERGLEQLRVEVATREKTIARAGQWRRELSRIPGQSTHASPHAATREMWMKHFESLATDAGVQLLQRAAITPAEKGGMGLMRVECSLQGGFEPVVRFLHALATDESRPQIEACQLSPLKSGEDRLQARLSLAVFFKPTS